MEYIKHRRTFVMLEEQNRNFAFDRHRKIRGYLKIETGGGKGAMRVQVENLKHFDRGAYVYKLILFGKKKEKTIYQIMGDILLGGGGRGETYLRFDPKDVDGKENDLENFPIAIIVAVSATDPREALHPVLRGSIEPAEKRRSPGRRKKPTIYNDYYNQFILDRCRAIEHKIEMYDSIIPFKEDKTNAEWKRVVNMGKFPIIISPGATYTISRYRHFIYGIGENHYFLGVPGRYMKKEQPEEGKSGFVLWQPIVGAEKFKADSEAASLEDLQVAYGYWIAAVNKETGFIEEFGK